LTGAGIGRASRSLYPLLDACANLYLELSRYTAFRTVDGICERFGARRLIYGSGLPLVAPGVAMTTVTHALIGEEDKALIAAGNLRRLIGEVMA
jgi:predicted TIM-barrel fold metal-dependent hydrolase